MSVYAESRRDQVLYMIRILLVTGIIASAAMYLGYDIRRRSEPAPEVVTVYEPVLWVRDADGMWHCEPWATAAEALDRCSRDQLPDEASQPSAGRGRR